ncbi:hypothetical protein [Boudabousia marimammalium]|uniref:Gram-positive cocci surface proteins LPxTG domain-containing protein n=1 Tax=Boudabousia marimammalium TaxID=156892 RepID=A0A1Q5PNR2_9ACTO|nr:hypothetical protein [Boudabousia marimammalium]OKL49211.1 hypothetical protein BM477_04255 [Boudabousia marimammalium]
MNKLLSVGAAIALLLGAGVDVASADENTFEVTSQTTAEQINAAIADPNISVIHFSENVVLTSGIKVTVATTMRIDDGVVVSVNGPSAPGLDITANLELLNHGEINILYAKNGAIKVSGNADVSIVGDGVGDSSISAKYTSGIGVDAANQNGTFSIKDSGLFVSEALDTTEHSMVFGAGVKQVAVDSSYLHIIQEGGNIENSAFISEAPINISNSHFHVSANAKAAVDLKPGASIQAVDSTFDVHVPNQRIPACQKPPEPVACSMMKALTAEGANLNFENTLVGIIDHSGSDTTDAGHGVVLTDSQITFKGNEAVIGSATLGESDTGKSFIRVLEDSVYYLYPNNIGQNNVKTIVDGGSASLFSNVGEVINSAGEPLSLFPTTSTVENVLVAGGNSYDYRAKNFNADFDVKHVWAPAVNVNYFDSCDLSVATPEENRVAIRGTAVMHPFNTQTVDAKTWNPKVLQPVPGRWVIRGSAQQVEFLQGDGSENTGTKVLQDIDLCRLENFVVPTPDPSPEITGEPSVEATVSSPEATATSTVSGPSAGTLPVTGIAGSGIALLSSVLVMLGAAGIYAAKRKVS